jgi:hypothetical protein
MIFFTKSIHFSDIYSNKCLNKYTIKMAVPGVCKPEKWDEAEVFLHSQNGVSRGLGGKCSVTNKWMNMLVLIHYLLVSE